MLAFVLCAPLLAQQNIRQVDFKNFTYPLSGHLLGHSSLEWLDTPAHPATKRKTFHLVDGSELTKISSVVVDGKEYGQYEGFTFQSVSYADLTGYGNEEAIVVLKYHSGGTQTTNYVYVYTFEEQRPKLLAYCHTGNRGDAGLYHVDDRNGLLVFELLDPARASGECCSAGVLIYHYKWQEGVFKLAGSIGRRTLPPPREYPYKQPD
jgi:hypothetical protein